MRPNPRTGFDQPGVNPGIQYFVRTVCGLHSIIPNCLTSTNPSCSSVKPSPHAGAFESLAVVDFLGPFFFFSPWLPGAQGAKSDGRSTLSTAVCRSRVSVNLGLSALHLLLFRWGGRGRRRLLAATTNPGVRDLQVFFLLWCARAS